MLSVAVAAVFGSRTRRGRPLGAALGAGAAGLLTGFLHGADPWLAAAVVLGAVVGWLAPAQGSRREAGAWEGEGGGSATGRW